MNAKQLERQAQAERIDAAHQVTLRAYLDNRCPVCRGPVKRNLSLTGWVQCAQYGSEQFRAIPSLPSCDWQGFTE